MSTITAKRCDYCGHVEAAPRGWKAYAYKNGIHMTADSAEIIQGFFHTTALVMPDIFELCGEECLVKHSSVRSGKSGLPVD